MMLRSFNNAMLDLIVVTFLPLEEGSEEKKHKKKREMCWKRERTV